MGEAGGETFALGLGIASLSDSCRGTGGTSGKSSCLLIGRGGMECKLSSGSADSWPPPSNDSTFISILNIATMYFIFKLMQTPNRFSTHMCVLLSTRNKIGLEVLI